MDVSAAVFVLVAPGFVLLGRAARRVALPEAMGERVPAVATKVRESESPPELNRPTGDGPLIRPPPTCDRSDRTYEQTRFRLPRAGLLVQVQLFVAFGWLVVTVKLFAVPVMVQVTPPEPT